MHARGEIATLGLMAGGTWEIDPKRLVFTLSRYEFVAKMLEGRPNAVEIGAADGFASRIVQQAVGELVAVDFDALFVDYARAHVSERWPIEFAAHDLVEQPVNRRFSSAYALDVLEHIEPQLEEAFLRNMAASLTDDRVAVVGMPSLESQPYASAESRADHVNCQSAPQLRTALQRHFTVVFMFSMNDEVVHTGFHKMANYILGVCAVPSR